MFKRQTVLFALLLALFVLLPISAVETRLAGSEEADSAASILDCVAPETPAELSDGPALEDRVWDVKVLGLLRLVPQVFLKHVDIVAVWFSEDGAHPDELFVTLALRDFESQTSMLQAVYVVEWSYNYHHYGVVVHTDPSGIGFFLVGKSEDGDSDLDQWDVCSGTYDPDADTLTWELSKEVVGHPPPASRLTNTQAHTHLRFTTESGLPRGDLFKDLTHNAKSVQDYTIKY